MKLGLYQGAPLEGDIETGFARIASMLAAAAQAGARMVVFPELYLPGYNQPALHASLSQPVGGEWCDRLANLARDNNCGLTVGWAERAGDMVYNATTAFGPDGETLAHYRKIQLFGPMERASFDYGDSYCTFEFDGLTCSLLICYDVEFGHHVRALSQRGTQLILVPTANPAAFDNVSLKTVPAQAYQHAITIAYANYFGTEGDVQFGGHSVIAAPNGNILAAALTTETLLITDIDCSPQADSLSTQLADYREIPE